MIFQYHNCAVEESSATLIAMEHFCTGGKKDHKSYQKALQCTSAIAKENREVRVITSSYSLTANQCLFVKFMVLDFDKVLNSLQGVAGFLCLHQEKADQQLPSLLIRKGYSKGPDGILLHFLRAWVPNSETVSLRAALFPCEDHVESMSRQRCS